MEKHCCYFQSAQLGTVNPKFECSMAECRRTARDDEVKRGRLVIEQTGQQDSAVKETRV